MVRLGSKHKKILINFNVNKLQADENAIVLLIFRKENSNPSPLYTH